MITDKQIEAVIRAYHGNMSIPDRTMPALIKDMRKALEAVEQSKPKPEPVAYRWWNQGCNCNECDQYFYSEDPDFISKSREPLYTTPPTLEPLSEDFLLRLADECTTQFFNGVHQNATIHFARAVEQAHGIGREQ